MITMTPEVLSTYAVAIAAMDPDHERVMKERGAYERTPQKTWFEEEAHAYTATQLAGMLNMKVSSVREKASRLGITLQKAPPIPQYIK